MNKAFVVVLLSCSTSFGSDPFSELSGSISPPPNTSSEVSSRSNSPSPADEAVFTWRGLKSGNPEVIGLIFTENFTVAEACNVIKIIENLADKGNPVAQHALVQSWIGGSFGLRTTQHNQKERLDKLWAYAENNPLVHMFLIESYIEGYFGISPKKKSRVRKAKKFALDHLDSPGVGDLVIQAMKDEHLAFKSKREYLRHFKNKDGKRIMVEDKVDLRVIEFLAEQHVKSAQAFLIACYMNGKYGADSLDKIAFQGALNRMEALEDDNPELGALMVSVWQQNFLGYGKQRRSEYLKELSRIKQKYAHLTDDEFIRRNQFEALADLIDE